MSQREIQVYSYTLNIQSVKMKVKFPCKMKLEYAGEVLTSEVSQNESGKFIFNQEVTLKEDTERTYFEIIANIATDKGAKYIAGVIKLAQSELVHQEGEMMVIHLIKCLDSDACCELRVDSVTSEKVTKKVPIQKVMAAKNRQFQHDFSPKKTLEVPKNYTGTRSEFQFPISNSRQVNTIKTRQEGYQQSNYDRSRSPGNNFRKSNIAATYVDRNLPEFGIIDSGNRDKLIEAEVYKESYQKLKQKYKREAQAAKHELNKRIALQNNENNYKLEIMRLKLRCQQQEKTIAQKNNKLKQMQIQLASLQKKELDLNYLREQASNKEHTIRMLQDTIRTLNKDNEDLKNLNKERFESQQEKIRELRSQLDISRQKYEARLNENQKELKSRSQIIIQKDSELRIREQRIQREQRLVDELQKLAQTKGFEYERTLQNQQNEWKIKLEEHKNIIERLEKDKSRLEEQLQASRNEQEKIKSYVIKIEYDKKILVQETESFKTELSQIKILREKYQQLTRDHRILTEDKNHLQKQFQKTLQSKDSNLSELNKQFKDQLDHYRKIYKQVEQKMRNSQTKGLQLQSLLEQRKNEVQKMRKNNQALTKECNDLKEKQKSFKKTLKLKEEELAVLSAELDSSKYKTRSGDQLSRYEMENLRQQLGKAKRDLEVQTLRSSQQLQKITGLNAELNRMKLQLQQSSDQNQKDTMLFRQKISSMQNYNKQYQRRVEELNNLVSNLRSNDKQSQSKIQKSQLEALKTNEKIEKQQKEIRMLQDKITQFENQIKLKTNDINNLNLTRENLEKKIVDYEEKMNTIKNNLNTITGDKNKNDKIIELLNREISDGKQQADRQQKMIQAKEKLEQDLRNQLKKSKEEYLKLEMKNSAMKKQYDRFKQHLSETLSSTFSQIPLSPGDLKASVTSFESNGKRSDNVESSVYNAEILNRINAQNKDIKVAMSRVIEHNKMLQKEVERLSEQGLSNSAKNQIVETNLSKKVEQLENQINRIQIQKEQLNSKNKALITELQNQLDEREQMNKELILQIEQFNFTVNSLRMDQEASNQHYTLKQNQYKYKIAELEEKITYLTNSLNEAQMNNHNVEGRLVERTNEYETEKQTSNKKQKQIQVLKEEKRSLTSIVEDGKRQRKQLLEKISELQLKLNTEIELKQKGRFLLEDEERKGSELKDFVANLMKQKQMAIKGDLEKSQQIIALEASLLELTREKQMQAEQIQRIKKACDELKELVKKLNAQIKDLETYGTDEKGRVAKLNEKLRQKQRQLKENEESLSKIKSEYEKLNSKSSKSIYELTLELEEKSKQKDNEIRLLNQKIIELQKQKQEADTKITNNKSQMLILEQSLFMEKQASEVKAEECNRLAEQIEKLRSEMRRLEQTINTLNEQMKDKQEGMFQLSGKVYHLEAAVEAKENQGVQKLNLVSEDWSSKYESMVDEFQQRIELVEKEKAYFKTRLEEKQEQYRKLVAELRNNELEDSGLRKALQQKVKRLEEERLTLISTKNSQIQRLAEDNKSKFETLKVKEADLRRLQHELQVARSTINKLQQSKRETQEKIKQINKAYQSELEQLKRREASSRNSSEQLERIQWDVEREVKKTIQVYTKRITTVGESKEESQKILSTIKGLEEEVINAVSHKLSSPAN